MAAVCLSAAATAQSTADELIQAIRNNDLTGLRARLSKGTDVNTRDQRGSTLLIHAAAIGSPEAVKLPLESGADVNAKNEFGGYGADPGRGERRKGAGSWWKKALT